MDRGTDHFWLHFKPKDIAKRQNETITSVAPELLNTVSRRESADWFVVRVDRTDHRANWSAEVITHLGDWIKHISAFASHLDTYSSSRGLTRFHVSSSFLEDLSSRFVAQDKPAKPVE